MCAHVTDIHTLWTDCIHGVLLCANTSICSSPFQFSILLNGSPKCNLPILARLLHSKTWKHPLIRSSCLLMGCEHFVFYQQSFPRPLDTGWPGSLDWRLLQDKLQLPVCVPNNLLHYLCMTHWCSAVNTYLNCLGWRSLYPAVRVNNKDLTLSLKSYSIRAGQPLIRGPPLGSEDISTLGHTKGMGGIITPWMR